MKTLVNVTRNLTLAALTLAAVAIVSAPTTILAQEKGAERLLKLNRPAITTSATAEVAVMACPKCKDALVAVRQPMGRGGRVEMANVVKHECPSCNTKITTQGVGKQAKDIVNHGCNMNGGDAACCAVKKS